jgi:hypothetical protein
MLDLCASKLEKCNRVLFTEVNNYLFGLIKRLETDELWVLTGDENIKESIRHHGFQGKIFLIDKIPDNKNFDAIFNFNNIKTKNLSSKGKLILITKNRFLIPKTEDLKVVGCYGQFNIVSYFYLFLSKFSGFLGNYGLRHFFEDKGYQNLIKERPLAFTGKILMVFYEND